MQSMHARVFVQTVRNANSKMSDVPSDSGVFFNGLPIVTRLESVPTKVNDKHEHSPQGRSFGKKVTFRVPRLPAEWQFVVTNKHRDRLRKEIDQYRHTILEKELKEHQQKMLDHFELERMISFVLLLHPLSLPVRVVDKIYRTTQINWPIHVALQEARHLFASKPMFFC